MNNNLRVVMAIVKGMQRGIEMGESKEEVARLRWSISEISKLSGLNDNQVIKALNTLTQGGYVRPHINKYISYSLTPKCKEYIRRHAKKGNIEQ